MKTRAGQGRESPPMDGLTAPPDRDTLAVAAGSGRKQNR